MSLFQFKKFAINQDDCAMKINTDGVLIGAIAHADNPTYILDIGTGTGVITLMLAQRFDQAQVVGVEIDKNSAWRAQKNANDSTFKDRVNIVETDFQSYIPVQKIDLIVTNPPFYTNSLKNPDPRRQQAKHTDLDFFSEMIRFSEQYLTENGVLMLIVPTDLSQQIVEIAIDHLYLTEEILISSFEESEAIRSILRLEKRKQNTTQQKKFVIYQEKGVYSDEYRTLLKDFFLAF